MRVTNPLPSSSPTENEWTLTPSFFAASRSLIGPSSRSSRSFSSSSASIPRSLGLESIRNSVSWTMSSISHLSAGARASSSARDMTALLTDGHLEDAMHSGIARTGERRSSSPFTRMRLSPPIPKVAMSAAITLVRLPAMHAPSGSILGRPFLRTPMSEVVPPMSMTIASLIPVRAMAPIMLEAGPESIVSTGFLRAVESFIRAPSPFTIISGHLSPRSAMTAFTDSRSSLIAGMRRAFITAVAVL